MSSLRPETGDALRRIVSGQQARGMVPGIIGAVVRDGGLAWGEGIGTADVAHPGQPPTLDQQFLIASNSKTFTPVVIMALRDEAKLDLDDTLDRFIPDCGHPGLTILQMLWHVSGMQREPVSDVRETLEQPDSQELVRGFGAERVLKPHYRWHYSNLVYPMLGEVIARLDGRDWFDSVKARILDPLGMASTTLGLQMDPVGGYYVSPFHDVPVPEPTFAFGLGFMLRRSNDRIYVGHTGGMPGHISALFTHRRSGTGALVLMNSTSAPDPAAFAMSLADHVIEHEPMPVITWVPGSVVPAEYAGIIGRWYSEGGRSTSWSGPHNSRHGCPVLRRTHLRRSSSRSGWTSTERCQAARPANSCG